MPLCTQPPGSWSGRSEKLLLTTLPARAADQRQQEARTAGTLLSASLFRRSLGVYELLHRREFPLQRRLRTTNGREVVGSSVSAASCNP